MVTVKRRRLELTGVEESPRGEQREREKLRKVLLFFGVPFAELRPLGVKWEKGDKQRAGLAQYD